MKISSSAKCCFCLLLLYGILKNVAFAQQNEDTFKITQGISIIANNLPDTVMLGSAFKVDYTLNGYMYNVDKPFFSEANGFGIPQTEAELEVGNRIRKENGKEIFEHAGNCSYIFVATQAGEQYLPRMIIKVGKKKYMVDDHKMVVLQPQKPLRNINVSMQLPKKLKKEEIFELKIIIEGNCTDSFHVFLPNVEWMKELDKRHTSLSNAYRNSKSPHKCEYYFRCKATAAGTYTLPNAIVEPIGDDTYYLSNPMRNITVSKQAIGSQNTDRQQANSMPSKEQSSTVMGIEYIAEQDSLVTITIRMSEPNIAVGMPIEVLASCKNATITSFEISNLADFGFEYTGVNLSVTKVANGVRTQYKGVRIIPSKKGLLTIPPIRIETTDGEFSTKPIDINVTR